MIHWQNILSPGFYEDVAEYLSENEPERAIDELSAEEVWKAYLEWNGIIGYDSRLWELAKEVLPMSPGSLDVSRLAGSE